MGSSTDAVNLSYQPATEADIPVLFALSKALIDQYEDVSSIAYEKVLRWIQNKLVQNISRYTRVSSHEQTVGYYCLLTKNGETELDDFYILLPFQGRGIGTEVLKRCVSQVNTPIFLYVFKKNTGAICLYSRFGFVPVQDVGQTRMIMRREG